MDYSKLLGRLKEKSLTQAEVAKMIKVSPSTLNGKLNGHVEFSQSEIRNLCIVLGIQDSDIPAFFFTEKLEKSQEFTTERTNQNE